MYSSQELHRAQNCPYTLPSFNNSNSSHGCRHTCCVDRLKPSTTSASCTWDPPPWTRAPDVPLRPAPPTVFPSQWKGTSSLSPSGCGSPKWRNHPFFLPPHIQPNTTSSWFDSQIKSVCPVGSPLTFSENPIRSPLNHRGALHPAQSRRLPSAQPPQCSWPAASAQSPPEAPTLDPTWSAPSCYLWPWLLLSLLHPPCYISPTQSFCASGPLHLVTSAGMLLPPESLSPVFKCHLLYGVDLNHLH